MKKILVILTGVLALSLVLTTGPAASSASAHGHEGRPSHHRHARAITLRDVKKANDRYHSIRKVVKAGYSPDVVPGCFDDPTKGGMGVHYINASLLDDTIDPLKPEALVYEVGRNGKLRLVAVEYVVPPSATWPADGAPPTLFGHEYTMHPTLGVWKLHAWIWRGNPSGTFADFNPRVRMCP
jgi:hypothetical protein